jgi:phytoene desaturase
MSRIAVIGGGVGGLTVATRLADAGHAVQLFERLPEVGGKLAELVRDGFTFDIGPSLVTLPHLFDPRVRDRLDLRRLDPQFRYRWRDGHELVVGDGDDVGGAFTQRGRRIWEISERTFLAGPMGPSALRRMRHPRELLQIDALRTLARAAERDFAGDRHLTQWAGRYATYSGSSPYRAPATLACIAHVEHEYGCWYPMGGLARLRDALTEVAVEAGVDICTGAHVERILADDQVRSVVVDGRVVAADAVVANCDAELLYRTLLPHRPALRKVRRAAPSTSGFVVCAGVRGATPQLAHHNVWFSDDSRAEFAAIDAGRLADDPTIYACVSSVTDASQAPEGHENWFLLVNTPPGVTVDAPAYETLVLQRLAGHGVDLRDRLLFTETLTPHDLERRYLAPGGAIYGTSSNGRRAAFVRPANRGALPGLYLVGGSSHPGGGLPMVTISARIVADMIGRDLR